MAAGAIPPPLFFERRRAPCEQSLLRPRHPPENTGTHISVDCEIGAPGQEPSPASRDRYLVRILEEMANTTSAKKATRKIARRTVVNKARRTKLRTAVRSVEEAIKSGDRNAAVTAMKHAEPELMKAAQHNIIHRNNANRKVSRLTHQIARLGK
jgi:small subunit ribosomal protein S20